MTISSAGSLIDVSRGLCTRQGEGVAIFKPPYHGSGYYLLNSNQTWCAALYSPHYFGNATPCTPCQVLATSWTQNRVGNTAAFALGGTCAVDITHVEL